MPVTRTSVIVATATASWSTPDRTTRHAPRRAVLRRTGYATVEQFNQPRPKSFPSSARRMADVRGAEVRVRDATDRDLLVRPGREGARRTEGPRATSAPRCSVDRRRPGMRRHDVPEEDALLEPELCKHAVDDRRRGLIRARAGQLPLGGERNPGICARRDTRPPRRRGATVRPLVATQVRGEPRSQQPRARAVPVLVERPSDGGRRQLVDELRPSRGPRQRSARRHPDRYDAHGVNGELGATGLRGGPTGAADPPNLIWVMPAEEGTRVERDGRGRRRRRGSRARRRERCPAGAPVVAADRRARPRAGARALRWTVAVGDFYSASRGARSRPQRSRERSIERHPEAKDATDLELALDAALALDPESESSCSQVSASRLDHLPLGAARPRRELASRASSSTRRIGVGARPRDPGRP